MDINELQTIVNENQRSISTLDAWALGINKRVSDLESANSILTEIQVTLKELSMESRYFGKQLEELKAAVDRNNDENKSQHATLQAQITEINAKPGTSWEKAKWIIITGILSAATAFGIAKLFIQ